MDLKTVLGLAALLCGALASGVLLFRATDEAKSVSEAPRLQIGYYAADAQLTGTDDTGRILYRISAATVVQTPADGSVSLQGVAVSYDPAQDVPWSLRADTGRIPPGGKMIELSGNVVAATREADNPAATIRTDYLEFDPGTNVAATDRKVVIDYAGSTVYATGLRAMLQQDRFELLSNVTGQYVR
jgi:LPS export ABC transporter protein LptC